MYYFRLSSLRQYLLVWPDEQRIVRHSRMSNDEVATLVFGSREIRLDPPGITVEDFYAD